MRCQSFHPLLLLFWKVPFSARFESSGADRSPPPAFLFRGVNFPAPKPDSADERDFFDSV
jgi:hypothetical protein